MHIIYNMKFWAIFIIVASGFCFILAGYNLLIVATHPIKFNDQIILYSNEFSLDPSLVASLINVESSYRENAVSNKSALGLMQIKLSTAEYLIEYYNLDKSITSEELLIPNTNIYFGCMYLRYLMNKFEDPYTAIASYNAGETRVRVWLSDSQYSLDGTTLYKIPYKETSDYIIKIKKNIKFYSKIYINKPN